MNVPVTVIVNQAAVVMMVAVRLMGVVMRMALLRILVSVAMSMRMRVFMCLDMVLMVVDRRSARGAEPLI